MRKRYKWIIILLGVLCICIVLRAMVFSTLYISSDGMANSLYHGDRVLINKQAYGLQLPFSDKKLFKSTPRKGDIVFLDNPLGNNSKLFSKQIYPGIITGLPGDTIEVNYNFRADSQSKSPRLKRVYKVVQQCDNQLHRLLNEYNIAVDAFKRDTLYNYYPLNDYEAYIISQNNDSILIATIEEINSNELYKIVIPKQGEDIIINSWNFALVYNSILLHEPHQKVEVIGNQILYNGVPIKSYRFTKDYYWITVYNNDLMVDSSTYGFVPEDLIIGTPLLIWLSKRPNTPLFSGYNYDRIFKLIR